MRNTVFIILMLFILILSGCGAPGTKEIENNDMGDVNEIIQSEEEITFDESSAYGVALSYLKYFPMSQSELKQQLLYDNFTEQEIDSLFENELKSIDWNRQAKLAAESFLDSMEFTEDELRDQLIYNGFTTEQVDYAIEVCKDKFNN